METRRVWRIDRAGSLARLRLQQEPLQPLAEGDVRIDVKAVGLNFADIFALAGLYSATPKGPFIPGLELSGIIRGVGPAVTDFHRGNRVVGLTRFGAYSDTVDVNPSYVVPLPDDWDFAVGAAYLVQTLTAYYALRALGDLQPGQHVLVHSAAGGVGLRALAICRALGASTIATVSTPEKKAFLEEQGYEDVFVRTRHLAQQLSETLRGRPLDLVLDGIGGKVQKISYDALAPTGRLVVFGAAEFTPGRRRPHYVKMLWRYLQRPRYDALELINDNKSIHGFNLIWLWQEQGLLLRALEELRGVDLPAPHVGHRFPFEQAPQGVEALRNGKTIGKVVLLV